MCLTWLGVYGGAAGRRTGGLLKSELSLVNQPWNHPGPGHPQNREIYVENHPDKPILRLAYYHPYGEWGC